MRRFNKIIMMTVSVLLACVLISSCLVSNTMAKYVIKKSATTKLSLTKFGISSVTSGTDLASSYSIIQDINGDGTADTFSAVSSTQNVVAPGTRGCLAWVRIKGTPSVAYNVDFTGSFEIGDGFKDDGKYILDESGKAIDYFPVIIYLIAYDVKSESNGVLSLELASVTNINNKKMQLGLANYRNNGSSSTNDYIFKSDVDSSTEWRASFAIDTLLQVLNNKHSTYLAMSLNNVFDHAGAASTTIDRLYTVQWCWPYNNNATYLYSGHKQEGATGGFLKREYDTQIAEAMREHPGDFKITADLDVNVTQAQAS